MNIRGLLLVIACLFLAFANVEAQENMPAISPTATITTATGETQEVTEYSGSAPLQVHFAPNVGYRIIQCVLRDEPADRPFIGAVFMALP